MKRSSRTVRVRGWASALRLDRQDSKHPPRPPAVGAAVGSEAGDGRGAELSAQPLQAGPEALLRRLAVHGEHLDNGAREPLQLPCR